MKFVWLITIASAIAISESRFLRRPLQDSIGRGIRRPWGGVDGGQVLTPDRGYDLTRTRWRHDLTDSTPSPQVKPCHRCPPSADLDPCECKCRDNGEPEVSCGPQLTSCQQLTSALYNCTQHSTTHFHSLTIAGTSLDCVIENQLWGPVTFTSVILNNNEFTLVDNNAFTPFKDTLTTLNLAKNKLQNFMFPLLNELPNLEVVVVRNNALDFIPGSKAIDNPSIRVFKAASNKIFCLTSDVFAGVPGLELLDLSRNQITELKRHSLRMPGHTAATLHVDLSYNAIEVIEADVFSGMKECTVNLQGNQLLTLPEKSYRPTIDQTHGHVFFTVTENPFTCDCGMSWIVTNATARACFDNYHCPNLNQALNTVHPTDLGNCTTPTRI